MKYLNLWTYLFLALIFSQPITVSGIIVDLKNGDRVFGRLLREDPAKITLQIDGSEIEQTIERTQITGIVKTVDPVRLGELKPTNPASYRDYAEELAQKRKDPDAREMAIRLHLIAAYLEPSRHGRGSMRAMADLARSPAEARRFLAMSFLLDPERDRTGLKAEIDAKTIAPEPHEEFLRCLRLYRENKFLDAIKVAKSPGVKARFDQCQDCLSYSTFLQVCEWMQNAGKKTITADQAQQEESIRIGALRAEARELASKMNKTATSPANLKSWSHAVYAQGTKPVRGLALESVTEFDPRDCVFRQDRWTKP